MRELLPWDATMTTVAITDPATASAMGEGEEDAEDWMDGEGGEDGEDGVDGVEGDREDGGEEGEGDGTGEADVREEGEENAEGEEGGEGEEGEESVIEEEGFPRRPPLWLALDQIVDPQNLGALLRSAHFFGVDGVVTCAQASAPFSAAASKASSGAMEIMTIGEAKNLLQFLSRSRENGWTVVGADGGMAASVEGGGGGEGGKEGENGYDHGYDHGGFDLGGHDGEGAKTEKKEKKRGDHNVLVNQKREELAKERCVEFWEVSHEEAERTLVEEGGGYGEEKEDVGEYVDDAEETEETEETEEEERDQEEEEEEEAEDALWASLPIAATTPAATTTTAADAMTMMTTRSKPVFSSHNISLDRPTILVMGSEGAGLRYVQSIILI
jgi:tRNA G18 (ribose-2'-O)-methylase SpoU